MAIQDRATLVNAVNFGINSTGDTLLRYYSDGFITVDPESYNSADIGGTMQIPADSFIVISRQPIMLDSDNFGDAMTTDIRSEIFADKNRGNRPNYFKFKNTDLDSPFDDKYFAQYSRLSRTDASTIFPPLTIPAPPAITVPSHNKVVLNKLNDGPFFDKSNWAITENIGVDVVDFDFVGGSSNRISFTFSSLNPIPVFERIEGFGQFVPPTNETQNPNEFIDFEFVRPLRRYEFGTQGEFDIYAPNYRPRIARRVRYTGGAWTDVSGLSKFELISGNQSIIMEALVNPEALAPNEVALKDNAGNLRFDQDVRPIIIPVAGPGGLFCSDENVRSASGFRKFRILAYNNVSNEFAPYTPSGGDEFVIFVYLRGHRSLPDNSLNSPDNIRSGAQIVYYTTRLESTP